MEIKYYWEKDFSLNDLVLKQKEEIERLQNIIEKNKYTADELNEIERLNNIINELEKDLQNNMAYYDKLYEEQDEQEYIDKYFALKEVLDKLQELKGEDKE